VTNSTHALLLVAHGSRHPNVARQVDRLRSELLAALPDHAVHVAYLEHGRPDVPYLLAQLAAAPLERCTIVPLLLSDAHHASVDMPRIAMRARAELPWSEVVCTPSVADHPALRALSARWLHLAAADLDTGRPWHYVFLGRGGADPPARYRELTRFLEARGLPPWIEERRCALLTEPDWETVLQRHADRPLIVQPHLLFAGSLFARIEARIDALRAAGDRPVCLVPPLGPAPELVIAVIDRVQSAWPQAAHCGSRSTVNDRVVPAKPS